MDIRIVVFILYLLLMLGIGFYFYRKNKSVDDYILGGRKLNVWVAAMSAQASDMSGYLLMGLPGLAYCYRMLSSGPVFTYDALYESIWTAIGLAIGTYLNWLLVAKRLRKYTQISGDSITLSQYFANRFEDHKGLLKPISSVIIIITFAMYTAAQFSAGAKLFNAVFGLDYTVALIVGAVVIVGYTFLGGFLAVCWTDLIQGVLMFFALIVVPIAVGRATGGFSGIGERMQALALQETGQASILGGATPVLIISSMAWGLGYFGMPHIVTRFMGIRSPREVRPARIIAIVWVVITMACAIALGYIGTLFVNKPLTAAEAETIFIMLAEGLFHPAVQGVLLTAILAAIMSTADSQLLVASSAFAEDIYGMLARDQSNSPAMQKKKLLVSRGTVIAISIAALVMALDPGSSVFRLVQNAWALLGAAFGPTILLSLYWKRMNRVGALAGMLAGAGTAVLWKALSGLGGVFAVYELLPGFVVGVVAIVIGSLCSAPPSEKMQQEFELSVASDDAFEQAMGGR